MRLLLSTKSRTLFVNGAVFLAVLTLVFGTVFSLTADSALATHLPGQLGDEVIFDSGDGIIYYKTKALFGTGSCYSEDAKNPQPDGQPTTRNQLNCDDITGKKSLLEKALGSLKDITVEGMLRVAVFTVKLIVTGLANILFSISDLLGFAITLLILGMGTFISDPASIGIQEAWKIIRDIANIGIVGGLVATAIGTIIKSEKYNINVTLAKLIIAALLVNFSYFFTGALIDIANVTTVAVYKSTIIRTTCAPGANCTVGDTPGREFTERVFEAIGLPDVARVAGEVVVSTTDQGTKMGTILYNLLLAIFMLIFGFYLLQVFFLLLVRFVALIFLLITSPAGIAGLALPFIKTYVDEWWKALYTQSLFPIVFFLLTGVALTIVKRLHPAIIEQARGADGAAGFAGQALAFAIAFAFLSIALRVAKQLSEQATWFKGAYAWTNKNLATPAGQLYRLPLTSGLRWAVGRQSDKALIWYNNRIAPTLRKVPGLEGLDRGIQGTLKAGKDLKPLGAKSYQEVKTARQTRDIEIRNREKEMAQRKEADKATQNLDGAQKRFDEQFKYENRKQKTNGQGELLYFDENGKLTNEAKGPKGKKRKAAMETMMELQARLENEKGPNGEMSLKDAGLKLKSALADMPPGTVERWFDEDPKLLPKYAAGLSEQQFLKAMESEKIPENLKNQMREVRHGEYMNLVRGLQKDVDDGRVLEGSEEYGDRIAQIFNYAKENLRSKAEFLDLVVSKTGKDMRDMRVLWHGSTNGMYTEVQNSNFLSEEEKYFRIRPLKQQGYLGYMSGWSGAEMIKGRGGELPYKPEDGMDAQEEARAWAYKTKDHSQKVIANASASATDKEKAARYIKFADFVLSGAQYETLSGSDKKFVDEMQLDFEVSMKGWFPGKQPGEVATEMLDRAMYHPLAARGISTAQLGAINQDDRFMTALRDNVLISGDEKVIQAVFYNPDLRQKYGWPDDEDLAKVEAERRKWAEKMGVEYKPLDQIIAESPEAGKGGR